MGETNRPRASWASFEIDGGEGDGSIRLAQSGRKSFILLSTIRYGGRTGLERFEEVPPASVEAIRTVTPADLPETDLASVPLFLRWFVSPFGRHTPAALVHDRLIGLDPRLEGITDQLADRYFRHMLEDLGIRFIRRWLMWTATAFRTRYAGGPGLRSSLIAWSVLALVGQAAFTFGVVTTEWTIVLLAVLAPLPSALLWGRQYGAGLVASYLAVPWVTPPTVFASIFYALYVAAEYLLSKVFGARLPGDEPINYRYF